MVRHIPAGPDEGEPTHEGSSGHVDDIELIGALTRPGLSVARFDRWSVWLPPRSVLTSATSQWTDTLGLVARGHLIIDDGSAVNPWFTAGDLLALGALPACRLSNPGDRPTQLVVVRRRRPQP